MKHDWLTFTLGIAAGAFFSYLFSAIFYKKSLKIKKLKIIGGHYSKENITTEQLINNSYAKFLIYNPSDDITIRKEDFIIPLKLKIPFGEISSINYANFGDKRNKISIIQKNKKSAEILFDYLNPKEGFLITVESKRSKKKKIINSDYEFEAKINDGKIYPVNFIESFSDYINIDIFKFYKLKYFAFTIFVYFLLIFLPFANLIACNILENTKITFFYRTVIFFLIPIGFGLGFILSYNALQNMKFYKTARKIWLQYLNYKE